MSDAVHEEAAYRYVGSRPVRPDGVEKVTGKANYGADEYLPGMIHGVVIRSPHAHARVRSIDASAALAMDGVFAVITAADFPSREGISVGRKRFFENIIASDKVLYNGQPVAALAAKSRAIAEAAARSVQVEYEVLDAVLDMQAAEKDDAPLLHEDMFTQGVEPRPEKPSNIASVTRITKGDVEAGFAAADVVIERSFVTPMVHQGYIEPHACVADFQQNGRATVWCSSQGHFGIRDMTALALGMDTGDIRVVAQEIGGGFGGKTVVYLEPLALKLSELSGRPVKMVMHREDVFRGTGPASGTFNRVKIGAKRDGTFVAMYADLLYEAGAFPGSPLGAGAMCIFAPYDVEHVLIEGREVVVNKPRVAAYRAPGAPQSMFAGESVIDELAQELGMDPIDLRLKNAARQGTHAAYGPRFKEIGLVACLEAAKAHPNYARVLKENQGRGVACGFWFNAGNNSSAEVHIAESGMDHVEVRKGIIEALPVDDASVDWVISNCVINLSPEKDRVYAEAYRVLRPGGIFFPIDFRTGKQASAPNAFSTFAQWWDHRWNNEPWRPDFASRDFGDSIAAAGFEVDETIESVRRGHGAILATRPA